MCGHEHKGGKVCHVCGAKIKEGEGNSKYYCMKCFKVREEQKGEKTR
jgi:predicted RNA-binding Zn-ribbon protein involved in translation (DUF1610 family)